ncbi:MAG TPA: universal stress protein [Solirubrobacteraceae bacterium]
MKAAPGVLPDPEALEVRAILLASEEREIPRAAVDLAARMARRNDAPVHVFSIARVWGTSLGFPNPGLNPTKHEWDTQHEVVRKAVTRLRRRGVEADGRVIGTRAGAKRIVREALRLGCDAIVMGADPPRGRLLSDFMWSQEPYRVQRRAGDLPVYLVVDGARMEPAA